MVDTVDYEKKFKEVQEVVKRFLASSYPVGSSIEFDYYIKDYTYDEASEFVNDIKRVTELEDYVPPESEV